MFSFFRSKKHSPDSDSSNSESLPPIPAASSAVGEDEYIVIDKKNDDPVNKLYPSFDGTVPYHYNVPPSESKKEVQAIHNLHGVPFVLSKELILFETMETYIATMSEAVSYVTAKLTLEDLDYDYKLEKGILDVE